MYEPDGKQVDPTKTNSDTNDLTSWLQRMKTSLGIPTHRSDEIHTMYSPETVNAYRQDTRAWTVSSMAGHQLPQGQRCVSRANIDVNNNFDAFYSDIFLGDFQNVDTNQYNTNFAGEPVLKPEKGYQHSLAYTNHFQSSGISRNNSLVQPAIPPPFLPTPSGAGIPYGRYFGRSSLQPNCLHVYDNHQTPTPRYHDPGRNITNQHQTSCKDITRTSSCFGTSDVWNPVAQMNLYRDAFMQNRQNIHHNTAQEQIKTFKTNTKDLREKEKAFDNHFRERFKNQDPIINKLLTNDDLGIPDTLSSHSRDFTAGLCQSETFKKAFAIECDVEEVSSGLVQDFPTQEGTDSLGIKATFGEKSEVDFGIIRETYITNEPTSDRLPKSIWKEDKYPSRPSKDIGDLGSSTSAKSFDISGIQDDIRGETSEGHPESATAKTLDTKGGLKVLRNRDFESLDSAERITLRNEMLKHLKMWSVEDKIPKLDEEVHRGKVYEKCHRQNQQDDSMHPRHGENVMLKRNNNLLPIGHNSPTMKELKFEPKNGKIDAQDNNLVHKELQPQYDNRTEVNLSDKVCEENLPWTTTYRQDEIFQKLHHTPDDRMITHLDQKANEGSESIVQEDSHRFSPGMKTVSKDHPWTAIRCRPSSANTPCDVSSSGDKKKDSVLNSDNPCPGACVDLVTSTTGPASSFSTSGHKRGVRRSSDEPRRPKNGFIRFSIENRHKIASEHPKLDNREISRILGIKWRKMDLAAKKAYEDAFEKDIQTIREEHPEWRYAPAKRLTEDLVEPMPSRLRPRDTLRRKHAPYVVRTYNKRGGRKKQEETQKMETGLTGAWVQCDLCGKWRCLPSWATQQEHSQLWFCHCIPDPLDSSCQVKEEANTRDPGSFSYCSQDSPTSHNTSAKTEDSSPSSYSSSNTPSHSVYSMYSNSIVPSPSLYNTYSNSNAHVLYREPTW